MKVAVFSGGAGLVVDEYFLNSNEALSNDLILNGGQGAAGVEVVSEQDRRWPLLSASSELRKGDGS